MNNANERAPSTPSFYLHKIHSPTKRAQVVDILKAIHPCHSERLWVTGFLKFVGYSIDEVLEIFDKFAEWSDYSQATTQYQVSTIFHQPHHPSTGNTHHRNRKWQLTPTQAYRCKYYRTIAKNRELDRFARVNAMPIYDACPELPFDVAKIGGFVK